MEAKIYNQEGKEVGAKAVSDKVFGVSWNPTLVEQAFLAERAGARRNIAHTKDRAEVSGGGKKPWQQKGTGRSRHGSIRSPIWIGGGTTHGPRNERDYSEKLNKKARRKAIFAVLSQKLRDGEIFFLEDLKIPDAKTKKAKDVLEKLPSGLKASTLVILPGKDDATWRALRNIKNIDLIEARNVNTTELLTHKYLIIPFASGEVLEKTFSIK